jgi:glyoxylase-like metal-dependent hydrolase (beta-lactamase superfamily II)
MRTTSSPLSLPFATTLTAAAATASCAALLAACGASSPEVRPTPALEVHTFTSDSAGFDTHSFWIDTGKEVVVFDGQFTPALADQVIADVRAHTASPIRWLVVTHPNPDKFNGAPRFQALGAKVVASKATADAIAGVHAYKRYFFVEIAKQFTAETYPAQATVDVTFEDRYELPLAGNAHVTLTRLAHSGVSSTQTVAFVPEAAPAGALFVGDLVHHGAHAWLEGGIADGAPRPDLDAWAGALDELSSYPAAATVYGGRGDAAGVAAAVTSQKAYLALASATVDQYLSSLGPKRAELADPATAQPHYGALEQRLAQAMPERKLSYLVRYGIYGLVQARLH